MLKISAIAFDMDGLLFDTENLAAEGWIAAGKKLGYPIGEEMALKTCGVDKYDSRRIFEELYGTECDYYAAREERLRCMFEQIEEKGMPLKDGVQELLDYLDDHAIPYTLATSTERGRVDWYMECAGLTARFRHLVCGDMVAHGKPAPDIYEQAAKEVGFPPEEVLALEDAPLGIEAARRAGLPVVMVPDMIPPDAEVRQKTLKVVKSLRDVIPLLEENR